jgi:hypothetical protein
VSTKLAIRLTLSWLASAVSLVGLVAGCKCEDQSRSSEQVRPDVEAQQATAVDRVRFKLRTPDDYVREAYLAIDLDNVKHELDILRREVEAELAGPNATSDSHLRTDAP